jgi:hypothetical protein
MVEISTKVKVIVFVVFFIALLIAFYIIYKKKTEISDESPTDKILNSVKAGDVQIYCYSTTTDTIYMRDINANYWIVGPSAQCPTLAQTAVQIQDVYATFSCDKIPDEYKDKNYCGEYTGQSDKFVNILIKSASDTEAAIIKNANKKTYTPSLTSCFATSSPSGNNNSPNLNPISFLKQKFMSLGDWFKSHADEIKESAISAGTQLGLMGIVVAMTNKWAIIMFLLPTIINGTNAQRIQAGAFGGQMVIEHLLQAALKSVTETIATRTAAETADIVGESIFDSIISSAVDCGLRAIASAIPIVNTILTVFMLLGMFIDIFDPCGLNSGTLAQSDLDKIKLAYDGAYSAVTGGISYPTVWDASLICEYNLDCNVHWNNCMSAQAKAATTKDIVCKADQDLLKKYSNEYMAALKYNSMGQCINRDPNGINITNQALQKMLEEAVPSVDWSSIGSATKDDIVKSLPTNLNLKNIDLLFTDNNYIEANYVAYHWIIFSVIILLLLSIMFFL